jgi:hypothetical protein
MGMGAAHPCNPSTQKAEAGGSSIHSQPGLHTKTLFQKQKCGRVGNDGLTVGWVLSSEQGFIRCPGGREH